MIQSHRIGQAVSITKLLRRLADADDMDIAEAADIIEEADANLPA